MDTTVYLVIYYIHLGLSVFDKDGVDLVLNLDALTRTTKPISTKNIAITTPRNTEVVKISPNWMEWLGTRWRRKNTMEHR